MNTPITTSVTTSNTILKTTLKTPKKIILVAGFPGVGKTQWIQQQLTQQLTLNNLTSSTNPTNPTKSAVYLNLGQGVMPIDAIYLAAAVDNLEILTEEQLNEFLYHWQQDLGQDSGNSENSSENSLPIDSLYIELGFHIDPTSLTLPVEESLCHRVAVVSSATNPETNQLDNPENNQLNNQELWRDWADTIVPGLPISSVDYWQHSQPQIIRSILTGQVIDGASLETFWYELTHGAYGEVQRAKGIFTPVDGRVLHLDFVAGLPKDIPEKIPETITTELPLPPCTKGRPDQFSGVEIIGFNLDRAGINQTLEDSCLDDQAIAHYQAQIEEQLTQMA
jgi:hypothetical protein